MLVHLLDFLLIFLDDKMTFDFHRRSQFPSCEAEVAWDDDELVNLKHGVYAITSYIVMNRAIAIPWQRWTQLSYSLSE